MNWFGYVWVVALALAYLLWTIKCVRDFIDDVRSYWKLSFLFEQGISWSWWIIIHGMVIIAASIAYFLWMKGALE